VPKRPERAILTPEQEKRVQSAEKLRIQSEYTEEGQNRQKRVKFEKNDQNSRKSVPEVAEDQQQAEKEPQTLQTPEKTESSEFGDSAAGVPRFRVFSRFGGSAARGSAVSSSVVLRDAFSCSDAPGCAGFARSASRGCGSAVATPVCGEFGCENFTLLCCYRMEFQDPQSKRQPV
jgi:hypothetical protein